MSLVRLTPTMQRVSRQLSALQHRVWIGEIDADRVASCLRDILVGSSPPSSEYIMWVARLLADFAEFREPLAGFLAELSDRTGCEHKRAIGALLGNELDSVDRWRLERSALHSRLDR